MSLQDQVLILEQAKQRFARDDWPFLKYAILCGIRSSYKEAFQHDPRAVVALEEILAQVEESMVATLTKFVHRLGVSADDAEEVIKAYAQTYAVSIREKILQEYPYLGREALVTRTELEETNISDLALHPPDPKNAGLLVGLIDAYIADAARNQ